MNLYKTQRRFRTSEEGGVNSWGLFLGLVVFCFFFVFGNFLMTQKSLNQNHFCRFHFCCTSTVQTIKEKKAPLIKKH